MHSNITWSGIGLPERRESAMNIGTRNRYQLFGSSAEGDTLVFNLPAKFLPHCIKIKLKKMRNNEDIDALFQRVAAVRYWPE